MCSIFAQDFNTQKQHLLFQHGKLKLPRDTKAAAAVVIAKQWQQQ